MMLETEIATGKETVAFSAMNQLLSGGWDTVKLV